MLKAVIFDFGDTLILTDRFNYEHCLKRLFQSLEADGIKLPYEDAVRVYFEVRDKTYEETERSLREIKFCNRIVETLKRFSYSLDDSHPIIIRAAEAFSDAFVDFMRMEKNTYGLLEKLSLKYKLGMISNFAYAPAVHKTLTRFNLTKFFATLIISGEFGWRKPSPKIFRKALHDLRIKAEESVFVGDSLVADIVGARKVGMKAIWLKRRENKRLENIEADLKPNEIIQNLESLPEYLNRLQLAHGNLNL